MGQVIGLNNYKFGNKNNWRRWMWNKVKELIENRTYWNNPNEEPANYNKKTNQCCGIYLVGPKDIDREVAISKGFRNDRIYAVDLNKSYIEKVINNGGLGFVGDISHIISDLSSKKKSVDFIIADFHCGITPQVLKFANTLRKFPSFINQTVVCVNLLRGHDGQSNFLRENIKILSSRKGIKKRDRSSYLMKHRGEQFLELLHFRNQYTCFEQKPYPCNRIENSFGMGELDQQTLCPCNYAPVCEANEKIFNKKEKEFFTRLGIPDKPGYSGISIDGPFFTASYRSKNNIMDSVIFRTDRTVYN